MPAFCLIPKAVLDFKRALRSGEIDPLKLSGMDSATRRTFLEKYVGKENAKEVNALFESKLLLKNQKAGYISWAKKVAGMSPETKRDMISRIERMKEILTPEEESKFLNDLASKRLGVEITPTEAKTLAELSKSAEDLRLKAKEDGTFETNDQRLKYGEAQVNIEEYFNKLKLDSKRIFFRETPLKKIGEAIKESPGVMKSVVASLDNSFFGRQGIKTLYTHPKIWARTFLKSWSDIGKELRGKDAMTAIKSDIYSRPNALNGKYKAGGYGLNVLSEEAYPSSLPEKIPGFRRIYKASESAYNGAALRMRADLADLLIKKAEEMGVNTLDPEQAGGMGRLVSSMTGRGNIAMTPSQAKATNVLFFSIKFLKSNVDTLTAHQFDSKASPFVKREAAINLMKIVGTTATILTIAKTLNPNSVDEDPRSTNFGKVKVFGHWTDITGGMNGLLTLASKILPSMHDGQIGFWKKNNDGTYTDMGTKFGIATPLDALEQYIEGKTSPALGTLLDVWRRKTVTGQPVTVSGEIANKTPLVGQQYQNLVQDPASSSVLGSLLLDALGFSVSSSVAPNSQTNLIPEGKSISNNSLIDGIMLYANAIGTDPETAFNRIFTGQKIVKVANGTVMVQRMSLADSQAIKKKGKANNPQMKLDHTVPLELGGSNDKSNLKIVTKGEWSSYTKIENALGKALKNKKISKSEAQDLIKKFKSISDSKQRKAYGENILNKYK